MILSNIWIYNEIYIQIIKWQSRSTQRHYPSGEVNIKVFKTSNTWSMGWKADNYTKWQLGHCSPQTQNQIFITGLCVCFRFYGNFHIFLVISWWSVHLFFYPHSWITNQVITNFYPSDWLLISHDLRISCERQMSIRLYYVLEWLSWKNFQHVCELNL